MDLTQQFRILAPRHFANPVIEIRQTGQRQPRATTHNENAPPHNTYHVSAISIPPLASTTPVTPPTVNKKINPIAHSIGVANEIDPPHMVAIQLKILIPVGHRDNQRRNRKISPRINRNSRCKHMVRPHNKPHEPNRDHGIRHP
jgi:hypothetical protein